METMLLLLMILLTVLAIIIVYRLLKRTERPLYLCKDIVCKYEQQYCCMSCGQRKICEVCCDYEGQCEWRVRCEQ